MAPFGLAVMEASVASFITIIHAVLLGAAAVWLPFTPLFVLVTTQ
jgi:hypothetical protein